MFNIIWEYINIKNGRNPQMQAFTFRSLYEMLKRIIKLNFDLMEQTLKKQIKKEKKTLS